jgi:hypothetical protein
MHTISLFDRPNADGTPVQHDFSFPGSWNEARPEDLRAVSRIHLSRRTDAAKRFTLLRELAEIPGVLMKRMPPAEHFMQRVDVTDRSGPWRPVEKHEWKLLHQLDWAFGPPTYEKSLLPSFVHQGVRWYGPYGDSEHGFEHMTLNQWVYGTMLLQRLRAGKPEEQDLYLNEFLGAVYTDDGVVSEEERLAIPPPDNTRHLALLKNWTPDHVELRGARLADVPLDLKMAALLNFEAIHSTLGLMYRRVFDPEGGAQRSPQGLFGMAFDVAASGVFGDIYGTESAMVHKVLGMMEHQLFKDEQAAAKNTKPA